MIILVISLMILAFISFCGAMGADSFGAAFLSIAFLLAGFGVLLHYETGVGHRAHTKAYADLKAEGWNVTNKDVQWQEGTVKIGCLSFGLNKLNGKYQVTTDRAQALGGGYIIKSPTIQSHVATLCKEQEAVANG